jgi:hypothetical protein
MIKIEIGARLEELQETLRYLSEKNIVGTLYNIVVRRERNVKKKVEWVLTTSLFIPCQLILESRGPIVIRPREQLKSTLINVSSSFFALLGPFSLKGGNIAFPGAALYCQVESSVVFLEGVHLNHNRSTFGGAIASVGSVVVKKCVFRDNCATLQGGAIWAGQGLYVEDCDVRNNQVVSSHPGSSGGAFFVDHPHLIVKRSTMKRNRCAQGAGGAMTLIRGFTLIEETTIADNESFNAPGLLQGIGNVYVSRSHLRQNRSTNEAGGGGGICIVQGNVYTYHTRISKNETTGMFSAGILSIKGHIFLTHHTTLTHNKNRGPGGAIAQNLDGTLTLTDHVTLSNNQGASLGGALINFSGNEMHLDRSSICHNVLTDAQTIGETLAIFLGGLLQFLSSFSQQTSLFSLFESSSTLVQPILSELEGELKQLFSVQLGQDASLLPLLNSVAGNGIATLLPCPLTIRKTSIEANRSDTKSTVGSVGGGLFALHSPSVSLHKVAIRKNVIKTEGSGIYYGEKESGLHIEKSVIQGNISTQLSTGSQIFIASTPSVL